MTSRRALIGLSLVVATLTISASLEALARALPSGARVVAFVSAGTPERVTLVGRALTDPPPPRSAGFLSTVFTNVDVIESDELPSVPLTITLGEERFTTTTDSDGLFALDVKPTRALDVGHTRFTVQFGDVQLGDEQTAHEGTVVVVDPAPGIAVVSDFDDTIVNTYVRDKPRMLSLVLTEPGSLAPVQEGIYTLTVSVGRKGNGATTDGAYAIELQVSGTIIAQAAILDPQNALPPDSWTDLSAVAVVPPGSPWIGQDLNVVLGVLDGSGSGPQGQFDNVRLRYVNLGPPTFGAQCIDSVGLCANPDVCQCAFCVNDGECSLDEDCVCPDCAADASCLTCVEDGVCDFYYEGCSCADCGEMLACEELGGG